MIVRLVQAIEGGCRVNSHVRNAGRLGHGQHGAICAEGRGGIDQGMRFSQTFGDALLPLEPTDGGGPERRQNGQV